MEERRADRMLAGLKRAGLKLTPQRAAIVYELAGDATHPTAQELFERLRSSHPTMSFATVYNTLDALAAHGQIRPLRLGVAVRFDPNASSHHHAICDRCGLILDLPAGSPPSPDVELQGFHVRAEERIYRGLCSRCLTRV